jgi:hypothetical protein
MKESVQGALWAVYQMTVQGQPGPNVVCFQHEVDAVENAAPGRHRLIKGGILHEGEAERLARGTSGADKVRMSRKPVAELLNPKPDLLVECGRQADIEEGQAEADRLQFLFPALVKETGELVEKDEPSVHNGAGPDGDVAKFERLE